MVSMDSLKEIEEKPEEEITQGRDSNNEENVKIKVVVPILRILGWKDKEMDFEPSVSSGKVDILLKIDNIPKIIIEVKSYEKKLANHRKQVFNYAKSKDIKQFVLTNGKTFELFKVTKKWDEIDVTKLKPFETIQKNELIRKEGLLRYHIGREDLGILLSYYTLSVNSNYLELRQVLAKLKIELYLFLSSQIRKLYKQNEKFKEKIDNWIININWNPNWNWTDNFNKRTLNRFLKRKIESILENNKVLCYWKTCRKHKEFEESCEKCLTSARPIITKDWVRRYSSKVNTDFVKSVDNALKKNGFTLDIIDKFALEGAYTFINRILFLRIYEANTGLSYLGREFILQLEKLKSPKAMFHLIQSVFEEIAVVFEKIYNAPLFNDTYLHEVEWKKEIILNIIRTLVEFDFKQINIDLIGRLYEENLDRDIRNSIGQFYTPRTIIQFIMDQLDLDSVVNNIEKDKFALVLDPACGSGGFLIAFYDNLKNKMIDRKWNTKDIFKILSKTLFGLDIDNFAVQLSIMNLLVKEAVTDLEKISLNIHQMNSIKYPLGGAEKFIQGKTLPNGISLVSSESKKRDGLTFSELSKLKFRFIFGNPPFFEVKKSSFKNFNYVYPIFKEDNKPNIASLFITRYLNFLEKKGVLTFIFPASIIFSDAFQNVRKYIILNYKINYIVQLGKAFSDVGLEQIIISITNDKPESDHVVRFMYNVEDLQEEKYEELLIKQSSFKSDKKYRFRVFLDEVILPIIEKIEGNSIFMHEICRKYLKERKTKGRVTSKVKYETAIFRGMGWEKNLRSSKEKGITTPAIKGTNIMRYGIKEYQFIPNTLKKTKSDKFKLIKSNEKLCIQRLVSSKTRLVAAKANPSIITISTIETIILDGESDYDINFIMGILNSNLITYYVIDHIFMQSRLTTSLDKEYVKLLPIPKVKREDQENLIQIVKDLEEIVNLGISNNLNVDSIENSKEFKEKESHLNSTVYSYYGLTDDEISIIEEKIRIFYGIT